MSGIAALGLTGWDDARSSSAGRTDSCCTTRPPETCLQRNEGKAIIIEQLSCIYKAIKSTLHIHIHLKPIN